jgi:hypothetical protein
MPIPFILVRGRQVPLAGDPGPGCIQPSESGLEFLPTNTRCKMREGNPTLVTVHNKGGEGDGKQTYRVLLNRQLSVEYSIDRDGTIWQYADPAALSCAHMGKGNSRSIGIEVTNTVVPLDDPKTADNERRIFLRGGYTGLKARLFYGRGQHVEIYRGVKRRVLDHLPAQKIALRSLVLTLLQEFPTIPRRLPLADGTRMVTGDRLPDDWQGVAGHLHFQPSGFVSVHAHVDPALDAFDELLLDLAAPLFFGQ